MDVHSRFETRQALGGDRARPPQQRPQRVPRAVAGDRRHQLMPALDQIALWAQEHLPADDR
jgi:hypothetical protein